MQLSQAFQFVKETVIPVVHAQAWAPTGGPTNANTLIQNVLNLILIVVVIAAVVFMMFAGIQYVTSQGDAAKAKTAMASITNAIIGIIVAFAAYALVQVVMKALNFQGGELPT